MYCYWSQFTKIFFHYIPPIKQSTITTLHDTPPRPPPVLLVRLPARCRQVLAHRRCPLRPLVQLRLQPVPLAVQLRHALAGLGQLVGGARQLVLLVRQAGGKVVGPQLGGAQLGGQALWGAGY